MPADCMSILRAAPDLMVPFDGGTSNLRSKFGAITEVSFSTLEVLYFRHLDVDTDIAKINIKFMQQFPIKIKMQASDFTSFCFL